MTDRMLVTALQYLNKYGWAVIPCGADKKPLVPSWVEYQKRLPTEEEVNQWWKEHPQANIAVITGKISGLTVIDVDSEDGDEALWELLPPDFETVQVATPSGGMHYYCKFAEGTRNAARWITDCDIRSEGGYVVAPPSSGEKGSWIWVQGPEDAMSWVPDSVLRKLSRETSPATPAGPPPRGLKFDKGTRDENLFTVANALLKGGMAETDARTVLEMLAQSCNPPFSSKEVGRKIQSALNRQGRQHGEISTIFGEWLEGEVGIFSLEKVQRDLGIVDSRGKKSLSNVAGRLVKKGILERTGRVGVFRIRDRETQPLDFINASDDEIQLIWPLGIQRFFRLLPKNVAVLAGEQDAGKTAYLLALVAKNMKNHEIHYFSSEMGPEEFRNRLKGFQPEIKLNDWKKYDFFPHERDSNFADVIKPDAINIVDYLEVDGHEGREFWRVGGMLKDIRDRLNKGAAIVAIQKNPDTKDGHNLGLGGFRGMEKPRLYASINKNPNKIRLEKVKNWRDPDGTNPSGNEIGFKLVRGCRFQAVGEWHKNW